MLFVSFFMCLVALSLARESIVRSCGGDPHAIVNECASACRPTCANPNVACTRNCVINGCQCEPGYVLNKPNGKCIRIQDCPANLGCNGDRNAVITDCGSMCPPTCDGEPLYCPAVCVSPACTCKRGFMLCKATGKCVPQYYCAKACS